MACLAQIEPPWDQRLASDRSGRAGSRRTRSRPWSWSWACSAPGCSRAPGSRSTSAPPCSCSACLLDHADGELARLTGRTSIFGHYYDLTTDALIMTALFIGIGVGLSAGGPGPAAIRLGLIAGGAVALAILLRLELERRAGAAAVRQPNLLGFEAQDLLYLVGPATWLDELEPFLMLAAIGAPLYALQALWNLGRHLPAARRDRPGHRRDRFRRRGRRPRSASQGRGGPGPGAPARRSGPGRRSGRSKPGAGDLRDPASLAPALGAARSLFHVAAAYRLWARRSRRPLRTNVEGTRALDAGRRRAGVSRIVYTSSVATLEARAPTAAPPTRPRRPPRIIGALQAPKVPGRAGGPRADR